MADTDDITGLDWPGVPATVEDFTIITPVKIEKQRVWDLLCNIMEGGSYNSFIIVEYLPEGIENHPDCTYRHIDVPFLGGSIGLIDKYGDSPIVYQLDRAAMERGLKIMANKFPRHFADFLDQGDDVITADVFLQCSLLGDVIYG
jgi:hypothetical protein